MKKSILLLFALLFAISTQAQMRRNTSRVPQTSSEPTEEQLKKRAQEMEERKDEYIDNFLTTLEADEFQKHIIKQNINSFFEAKVALFKIQYEHSIDRKTAVENLENTHFKDLEELISESDMAKIKEMIKGGFDEKEVLKEKKEKRKKKKRKKDKN
ncbi:hypothetical protein HNV10_04470 [Winogradskyella litoriviva]|uniref:Uncharacterized protein n=1 Tax=Winogradskyella litoriviva TaxID=1220182 RepID=A0ABX2E240_9FLAO|nr:hypothetical protein [Winogradskyella litoriviva]NRD22482.1 hypothetical protein [Winogradskyella litoriviva]